MKVKKKTNSIMNESLAEYISITTMPIKDNLIEKEEDLVFLFFEETAMDIDDLIEDEVLG